MKRQDEITIYFKGYFIMGAKFSKNESLQFLEEEFLVVFILKKSLFLKLISTHSKQLMKKQDNGTKEH